MIQLWVEKNSDKEVTYSDLCRELADVAESSKLDFYWKGKPRGFAQRMSNLKSNLSEFFEIGERTAGGRKKMISFRPKNREAQTC